MLPIKNLIERSCIFGAAADTRTHRLTWGETRMALFGKDYPDASTAYRNMKAAPEGSTGGLIRNGLEELWKRYEPYADEAFGHEFAVHPDDRFWEMYLTTLLLNARKNLRRREQK
jgi:hypothetical protein